MKNALVTPRNGDVSGKNAIASLKNATERVNFSFGSRTNDGRNLYSEYYKNDKLEGEKLFYYPNGQLRFMKYYKNGMRTDISYGYFENGKINYKEVFENGKRNGPFIIYHSNGIITNRGEYENNILKKITFTCFLMLKMRYYLRHLLTC